MNSLYPENWDAFVLFGFFIGAVVQNLLFGQIVKEVQTRVPEYRRPRWWNPFARIIDDLLVYNQHRQLFPNSRLRLVYHIVCVIWSPFVVVGTFRILEAMDTWTLRSFRF